MSQQMSHVMSQLLIGMSPVFAGAIEVHVSALGEYNSLFALEVCFSQPRVHRLALEREHTEDALVHAPHRLAPDETLERLDAERELAQCERALAAEPALAQPFEVVRQRVLGTVNDAQVLAPAALDRRLHQTPLAAGHEVERLTTIPSPPRSVNSSHQRIASASLAGSVTSTRWCSVAKSSRSAARPIAASVAMCQRWSLSMWTAPSVAST